MRTQDEIAAAPGLFVSETAPDGGRGTIVMPGRWSGSVIWSWGLGWDHVSVAPYKRSATPSWEDMRRVKRLFFRDDEWAVEYHPPEPENVSLCDNCLHLWRPQAQALPRPPALLV